ncbi:glycosyltransferase family 4 protein [Chelatococcus sambhunathii]|uniref:Glycosyltransferase family 4 protein n=1 Tax=Chelatococcus sambhunathii TaxID=363953 RepID=A0ABU1DB42_9HYPH|nr:glycosyltransferase family 4 protein [Chelatococcus sambhunathii]MDR4305326.1 glycosyltransferase family 4 protein [Chelatococcus sambhunathii]
MSAPAPLRIMHVVRSPVGGIFRHIEDLARSQAAAGHRVGLICDNLTGGSFEDERIARLSPDLALGAVRTPMTRQVGFSDVGALARARAILAPLRPDVIHTHGAKGGVFGRLVGAWLGRSWPVATFYAPHGGSLHYRPGSLEGRIYFRVERALERITDALIHVSAYEQRAYVDRIGPPRCDAFVVRNGLRPAEFEPVPPNPDAKDFLFLGMLRDVKGVDLLIEALARLRALGRPATAVIVGDGPEEASLRSLAAEKGLGDLVSFRPSTPAREAFALGRTIVVPSRAESMPYVVLEAVAARMPIITTRVGGIPEIFGPYADELLAPDDLTSLVAAMAAVLDDPEAAARAAAARQLHIGEEFSVSEMSARVEKIYQDALERRGKAF